MHLQRRILQWEWLQSVSIKIVDAWDEQYSPVFGSLMKVHLVSSEPVYKNWKAVM